MTSSKFDIKQQRQPLSNFRMRLITGLVIALFTLGITCLGGLWFELFCLCIGGAVLHEWHRIVKKLCAGKAAVIAWIFFAAFCCAVLAGADYLRLGAVLGAGIILSFAAALWERDIKTAFVQAGGLLYAALFPLALPYLRGSGQSAAVGLYLVLFLYIAVWASDIGAYFFGRAIGGAKLAPKISPNKTWSGACGGVICSVAAVFCFMLWAGAAQRGLMNDAELHNIPNWGLFISAAFLLSLVSQAGDLLESWFKRRFGVKDSSNILPGHGGVMDRVDGLLPAAVVFALLRFVSGF